MKTYYLLFLITSLTFQYTQVVAQWEDMNTGLNMDITGVNFDGSVGFVSGKGGIYFTQTGGIGSSSWERYTITTSTVDSTIYEHTQFNHCFSTNTIANDAVFFCGQDTVLNQAVILSINPTNLNHMIVYTGVIGSSLSHIAYTTYGTRYYAVGDNGLVVSFLSDGTVNVPTFPYTDSLIALNIYGNRYAITAGNKLFHGILSTTGTFTNSVDCGFLPNWINDLQAYSAYYLKAVGNGYMNASVYCPVSYYSNMLYDEHPFNANTIIKKGSDWIIGTDHGIYKEVNNSLEHQPSSNVYNVIDFGEDAVNTNYLYAACENGVVLRSSNYGGPTKPNVKVNVMGRCFGQGSAVSVQLGSAQSTTIEWWIDGVMQTNPINYGTGILPVGQHSISLTANNGVFSDSTSSVFYVVDTPNVSLPFTIIDDVLCHKEPLVVEFAATEDSIRYFYRNAITNVLLGETDELDGSFLSFVSDSISTSQPIIIEAESSYANCKKRFSDTIQLVVEHPKAFFHVDLINANPNEQIGFYNQSSEATNYDWTFYGSAAITASSDVDVVNSYTSIGYDSVHLSVWTDNFCYDSITRMSANIFVNPTEEDSCWLNKHYSEYYSPHIEFTNYKHTVSIEPSSTGYFAMGTYKNGILGSQYGIVDTLSLNGAYFAKYDENGILKWQVKTPASTSYSSSTFYEAIENSEGEVYISGIIGPLFVDNEGDTIKMTQYPDLTATLIKINANGKLLWFRKVRNQNDAWSLGLDQNENVFFIVNNGSVYDYLTWHLNDNQPEIIDLPVYPVEAEFCLFKLDPQGNEIWHLPIANYINNKVDFLRVYTDSLNNIYLAGQMDSKVRVFNPGSMTTYNEECASPCDGDRFFYYKLDEDGNYIWSMRAVNTIFSVEPSDIVVDKAGYSYITGEMHGSMIMENSDNSTYTIASGGKIFVIKINPDGMTQWIKSNTSGYYGGADKLDLVDDTLFVNCYTTAHSDLTINTSFMNNDGTSINLTIFEQDRMLAVIDTSGYIHRLITNGDNSGNSYTIQQRTSSGYFRLPNGKNFLSKSINLMPYLDSIYFDDFGEELLWGQIPDFNQNLGVVNAFYESCDNIFYPTFVLNENRPVCHGGNYTFPDGHTEMNITTSISHTSYLTSSDGIDSTIYTTINVINHNITVRDENVCYGASYTFPDGSIQTNIISNISDTTVLLSPFGCDSIVITNLLVNSVNTTIVQTSSTLTAIQGGATYSWLNCDNDFAETVPPAYDPSYQVMDVGNYAVSVTWNGCTDTSACIYVNTLKLQQAEESGFIKVYPNPSNGLIHIVNGGEVTIKKLRVCDLYGKIISEHFINQQKFDITLNGEAGVYFIHLYLEDGSEQVMNMVKQN